jgi:diguanylate cyclase (GGDEF) domain
MRADGGAGEHNWCSTSRIRRGNRVSKWFWEGGSPRIPQQLAISVASQVALSLASLQLRETLREQSIRDPLTRLFNRRFLEESLERELQLATRKKQAIAILFLDLDHFKRFNDTFGHDAGDMVLQSLADLFRTFFRATDICCRFGGEEFAIILPESCAQDASDRANALRSRVINLRLQYRQQTLSPLSISVGVAAFPEHASTSHELLKIADQCLYESKARGRDVVTVAPLKVHDCVGDS